MLKRTIFLIFLLFCFYSPIQAQEYVTSITSYGVAEGLLHRNVKSVTEDKNGFIWIGLENGLQRFDGVEFKTWNAENNFPQISNIRNVTIDDIGWLWAWNSNTDKFIFINTLTEEIQTQEQHFGKNFPTENGGISKKDWSTFPIFKNEEDGTLYLYNEQTIQIISYHSSRGFKIHAPVKFKSPVYHGNIKMVKNENDRFWMMVNGEKNLLIEVDINGNIKRQIEIEGKNIHHYASSEQEIVLLAESDQTLISVNTNNLQVEYQKHTPILKVWYAQNSFWELDNSKITLKNSVKSQTPILFSFPTLHHQIKLQNVTGSFEDSNKRLWLYGAFGLTRITLKQTAFKKYFYLSPTTPPTYNNATRNIIVRNDTLYTAVEYHGVAKAPLNNTNTYKIVDGDFYIKQFFYAARGMIMQSDGTIITTGNGVLKWLKGKKIKEERIELKDKNNKIIRSLPKEITEIWSLYSENEEIWIGTSRGLWVREANGNYKVYNIDLSHYNPIYFIENKGNFLWLGTENGLYGFQKSTKKFLKVKNVSEDNTAIYSHSYYNGNDYFGTEKGLLIKNNANKIQLINKTDGLSADKVYGVYNDHQGNIWMSTDNGISYINRKSGKISIFRVEDGISHNEFNRASHYKDKNGNIYFGGLNGITAINPKLGLFNQDKNLKLQVTSFEVFSSENDTPHNFISKIRKNQVIKLFDTDRFVRLRFAIPGTDNSKELLYAWKINEIDNSWNYQKENVLQFASLPYGKQVLYLKGQTNTGKWTTILAVNIEVLPPFYLQIWFIVLMILATIFLVIAIYKIRTKRLMKLQEELKTQIEIATEEIVKNKEIIEQQVKKLQKADEVKTRFFTNITHELRTPLSLIKGPLSSILKSEQLDEKNLSFLQIARKHTKVLQKLVTSLLDLSKLESGSMKVDETTFSLFECTRFIISNFESYIQHAGIEFIFDYKAERSLFVKLDKEKLEMIINNLISNAVKFTPKNGTITVSVQDNKNEILIKVKDTGIGIQPEDLPHIFNRFYQASNTDEIQVGGTGIGLALSYELTKLMKGSLTVTSEYGKGSCFTLTIPRNEVLGAFTPVAETDSGTKNVYKFKKSGAKILIVEDNVSLCEYLVAIMSEYYQVICAENGSKAIEVLGQLDENNLPDLIISDVMMPEMDGYQLLDYLKNHQQYWKIPVIMLTARVALQDKLKALRIGVDEYITKPFEEEELLVRTANLIKHASIRQAEQETIDNDEVQTSMLSDQNWLTDFEKYIEDNFSDETFSINKTSMHFAMSESTLLKKVKILTGLSPAEYLREYRLNKGKELLERGEKQTIAEVAFAIGFSNPKAFSQSFKTRFGKLPSTYFLKSKKE
ncbi:ATP-binding protein [Flavobacterium sp.]|uniref:hybrid sensor histidine kinase/response regulator transcription factor n=1 Tax=Flavobacterium sp. TaxID=239 RepID=UPI00262E7AD1|nr:ATP-binding protein [Flavobacterium sp.]MDD3003359.1 ATP-binding protein [Flavobacterium sp.]